VDVSLWTVGDVANWLETLSLSQYKDAFADAAVDGAFLFDLTDEDLRNTLGIEHALHRKKILGAVRRLSNRDVGMGGDFSNLGPGASGTDTMGIQSTVGGPGRIPPLALGGASQSTMNFGGRRGSQDLAFGDNATVIGAATVGGASSVAGAGAGLNLDELMRCVRHNKGKKLAQALKVLPERPFDGTVVRAPFVPGFGTQYDDALQSADFHINAVDENGNTLLLVAAQNGLLAMSKLLVARGANPNHQNGRGNTALHFALAYNFTELAEWLVAGDGGGSDDTIQNEEGLTPYDGLTAEEDY
jgi:hypothetical protein